MGLRAATASPGRVSRSFSVGGDLLRKDGDVSFTITSTNPCTCLHVFTHRNIHFPCCQSGESLVRIALVVSPELVPCRTGICQPVYN